MNVVMISFQKTIPDDVKVEVNGKPLNGLFIAGSHLESVQTLERTLTVEISAVNSIGAVDTIMNINHGDNFTYLISRDNERNLKLERKYGFNESN